MKGMELNIVNLNKYSKTHRHFGGVHIAGKLVPGRSQRRPFKGKTVVSCLFFHTGNTDSFSITDTADYYLGRKKIKRP